MRTTHAVTIALMLAACSAAPQQPRKHSAGGTGGQPTQTEGGSGGLAGAPEPEQTAGEGGTGGDASGEPPSEGGAGGDQYLEPATEHAGAGGDSGSAQIPGPAPASLWGQCDDHAPPGTVPCRDATHTCWPVLDGEYKRADHGICAPGCDSVHTAPGSHKVVFGLDLQLKADCEAMGGTCGRFGSDWQDACYPQWPPTE